MGCSKKLQVVWVKRDFRIYDNECLYEASKKGDVLVLYSFEPELWQQDDISYRHYLFVKDCVEDLQAQLKSINGYLNIYKDSMLQIFDVIKDKYGDFDLWSHQETGNYWTFERDKAVRSWCKKNNIIFTEPLQFGVWRGSKINRDTWAKDWDAMMASDQYPVPSKINFIKDIEAKIPTAKNLGISNDGIIEIQKGGRPEGLKFLTSFLYERGEAYRTDMSSPITGEDGCSRYVSHILRLGVYRCVRFINKQLSVKKKLNLYLKKKEEHGRALCSHLLDDYIGIVILRKN